MLKSLLCTAVAAIAASTLSASQIKYTYANNDYGCWGKELVENYDVAMRIVDPALTGKKIISISAAIYADEGISNTSLWLSKELKLNGKVNDPDLSFPASLNSFGELRVTLDEPYVIGDEGVYVGYSLNVDELLPATRTPLLLSLATNENGFYLHTSRSVLKWRNYVTSIPGSAVIEVVVEGDFPENAVALKSIPESYLKAGMDAAVPVMVMNQGGNPVNAIDFTYSFGSVSHSVTHSFYTPVQPDFVNAQTVLLPVTAPDEIGRYDFSITIDKVNAVPNNAVVNSGDASVTVVSMVPNHRPVMEEYTGTWCGWCPRGWFAMEEMNRLYPDEFIGIAYHDGDPMTITSTFPVKIDGYPSATIDRGIVMDPYYGTSGREMGIRDNWLDARSLTPSASVSAIAWWTDDSRSKIDVESATSFIMDYPEADFRLSYVLVANGLHSASSAWNQSNYLAKEVRKYVGTPLEEVARMGDPINDLRFSDVAVISKEMLGIPGSLPASIVKDEKMVGDYRFYLADAVGINSGASLVKGADELEVVVMVIDATTNSILNACKIPVCSTREEAAGIHDVTASPTPLSVAYYDLQGRRVTSIDRRGLTIKVTRNTDGTLTIEKTIR